eukprot:2211369-Pyramimonas_sp.AAC.1
MAASLRFCARKKASTVCPGTHRTCGGSPFTVTTHPSNVTPPPLTSYPVAQALRAEKGEHRLPSSTCGGFPFTVMPRPCNILPSSPASSRASNILKPPSNIPPRSGHQSRRVPLTSRHAARTSC